MFYKPVALFDVGNVLMKVDHRDYVRSVKSGILTAYDKGDPNAVDEYENICTEGFKSGKMQFEIFPDVNTFLENMRQYGFELGTYSTYKQDGIIAAFEKTGILGSFNDTLLFSTHDVNGQAPFQIKTAQGFEAIDGKLPEGIKLFADDNKGELERVIKAKTNQNPLFYLIGNEDPKLKGVSVISSVVDIPYPTLIPL